ncbi:hypothetical protein UK82_12565 [Frankia sp. ACN1ag]|nr:hypothetical protein UK82_12565 [Frankia sp. ACN1ag]
MMANRAARPGSSRRVELVEPRVEHQAGTRGQPRTRSASASAASTAPTDVSSLSPASLSPASRYRTR